MQPILMGQRLVTILRRLRRFDAEKLRGFGHAPAERPNNAGPGPDHTFERAAPVDPSALLVV